MAVRTSALSAGIARRTERQKVGLIPNVASVADAARNGNRWLYCGGRREGYFNVCNDSCVERIQA